MSQAGPPQSLPLRTWRRRVFRNTYTRAGRRRAVKGWAIQVQHQGRRRTFSLSARTRAAAAAEALAIHETLQTEGWDAALRNHARPDLRRGAFPKTDVRHWQQRLLGRRYGFPGSAAAGRGLTARVEHAGSGYLFPLGTSDPGPAATRALRIFRSVMRDGWEAACQRFIRELTVAFEWSSNPLLWTYATVHTLVTGAPRAAGARAPSSGQPRRVLIAEPDTGLRPALVWCVAQHAGFRAVPCDSAASLARALVRGEPRLVLLNRNLADKAGLAVHGLVAAIRPGVPAVTYSVYADSDQLFLAAPGAVAGYMLKRVAPASLFEPIGAALSQPVCSEEDLLHSVRAYFRSLLQSPSSRDASDMAKLTHREREVLALLSKGSVDKEIAQALGISAWTVHSHVKNIFEKLHVRSRTEAVVRYLEK